MSTSDPLDTNPVDRLARGKFLRLDLGFTLTLAFTAIVLPAVFGKPSIRSGLEAHRLVSRETALSAVVGLAVGTAVAMLIINWRPLTVIAEKIDQLVAWESFGALDFAIIALLAAVGEEMLFRGAIQPLLGVVPASLLFGMLHATAMAHIALAVLLGMLMGWLYEWSGTLWAPMAAHFTLNLATGVLLTRALPSIRRPEKGD